MTPLQVASEAVYRALRRNRLADASLAAERLAGLDLLPREIELAFLRTAERAGLREQFGHAMAAWLTACAMPGGHGRAMAFGGPDRQPFPTDYYIRPEIEVRADNLSEQIDRAEAALIDAQLGVYQRGASIVRVAPVLERARDGTETMAYRMADVDATALREQLSNAAAWVSVREKPAPAKMTEEGYKPKTVSVLAPCNCPMDVAEGYLARRGIGWHVPPLAGVIMAPTLRHDGSLLDLPGYDFKTGLLLDLRGGDFPEIPDRPTLADAEAALDDLLALLDGFPFVDDMSLAVSVSAILTAIVRPSLPTAPAHAVTATTMGTGKSFLCDLVATIATGAPVAPIAAGANDEELEKRLAAALIAGAPFIVVDNIDREINGPLLNQMLTQERVAPRRLGKSENVDVPCTAFVMLNGNNLPLPADMVRRVIRAALDARVERPELREFTSDPVDMVKADRWRYVAAALTILRAYDAAGRPDPPRPLAGYKVWSALVRGAVVWLGLADPVQTMNAVRDDDPKRQQFVAVATQWDAVLGCDRVTIQEVINAAVQVGEFREALLAVAGDHGAINGRRLGAWLGYCKGRIVGLHSFAPGPQRKGLGTWMLQGAAERSPSRATVEDLAGLVT